MFFIPGVIISVVTFPGVIVHELAHQLFCRLFRIPVFEVCYFRAGNPAGYVLHERVERPYQQILIAVGPWFVNTALAVMIGASAAVNTIVDDPGPLDVLLLYLAISIGMHAFPSLGDAGVIWDSVVKNPATAMHTKIVAVPIIGMIYIGALGSFVWLDAIYGVAVAMHLPRYAFEAMFA